MGIFKRKIKNTFDIARETGIDEEKIKELKNGERHIEGKTMEKVLDAINRSKVDRTIEKAEIFEWYEKTDLKKLREKFGYKAQLHLAKALNMDCGSLNRIENKKFNKINNSIIRLYDFYNNDFNKKIDKPEKVKENDKQVILDWYYNNDLKKLRGKYTQKKLAKKVGIPQSSLWEIENHKHKKASLSLIKLYNYYNNDNLCKNEVESKTYCYDENKVYNWYLSIDDLKDYRRKFGYSLNKMMAVLNLSYDQIRDFESHKYKSATPVVYKFYEFYNNEENRLPEIKLEDYNNPKFVNFNGVINSAFKVIDEQDELKQQLEEKDKRIAELERQIMLYEKLIERL